MTPEQEQLVLKIVSQLADTQLVIGHYYGDHLFECLFCHAEPSVYSIAFKHAPDCPVLLAQQLRKTINDEYERT